MAEAKRKRPPAGGNDPVLRRIERLEREAELLGEREAELLGARLRALAAPGAAGPDSSLPGPPGGARSPFQVIPGGSAGHQHVDGVKDERCGTGRAARRNRGMPGESCRARAHPVEAREDCPNLVAGPADVAATRRPAGAAGSLGCASGRGAGSARHPAGAEGSTSVLACAHEVRCSLRCYPRGTHGVPPEEARGGPGEDLRGPENGSYGLNTLRK